MTRPADTRARLQSAALDLFASQGFDETTAAEIAAQVGVTERTFFRHFPDKREAFFAGEGALRDALVEAVGSAASDDVHALVLAGLDAVAEGLQQRRTELRRRAKVVARHPELQERERTKLASWADGLAGALRARGVAPATATLAADVGVAVLNVAAQRWLRARRTEDLTLGIAIAFEEWNALSRS